MRSGLRQIIRPIAFIRMVFVFCLLVVMGMLTPLLLTWNDAFAQQQTEKQDEDYAEEEGAAEETVPKGRVTQALREKVYKKLSEAQAKAEANDFVGAMKIIEELKVDPDLNNHEKATTWQFTAYIYTMQERYPDALRAYEKVLTFPDLSPALALTTHYTMANLYLATEKYQKAIDSIRLWFKLSSAPTSSAYILLAQGHFYLEQYKQAIEAVDKGLVLVKAQNGQPPEQALLLLRASYFELENMPKVLEVLEMLVNLYPKGQYFSQLAILYGERGDEKRQLLTLESAYDGGYLNNQSQYVTLASLLVTSDVPYKAAKILTEGLDKKIVKDTVTHLRLLAQAWIQAKEPRKAIVVLNQAAKQSEDGELYIFLGNSHASLDDWKECATAVRAGLKKGKLDRADSAYITLGNCLYYMDDLDGAIAAFENARKDERSAKVAFQWSQFLRAEKERRQRLANSLL